MAINYGKGKNDLDYDLQFFYHAGIFCLFISDVRLWTLRYHTPHMYLDPEGIDWEQQVI